VYSCSVCSFSRLSIFSSRIVCFSCLPAYLTSL
jgi:hypothetical protein